MPSDPSPGISDLVFMTERNIARISAISGKFAAPCLNEWRYATKHVALLLEHPDDAEHREKAIGHLRRAYFDSSDILLTVLLDALREVFEDVGAYADVAERVISGYSGWSAVFSEAVALQGDSGEDRFAKARELDAMSQRLAVLVDRANVSRGNLLAAIARERRKDRLSFIGAVAAVVSALLTLAAFFR